MPSNLNLDYYYGSEAEQFSFYRVPKTLLTDPCYKSVSIEAKVLYGLLLDRMGLSVRNGWMDCDRRIYIYFTQEDAMALMNCGKDKATKLFQELDQGGIGLIERKKQGQGRPTRIYVKNFTLPPEPGQTPPDWEPAPPQEPYGTSQTAGNQQSRLLDSTALQTAEKPQSAPLETRGQDSGFSVPNKTEKNKTDFNDTESSILIHRRQLVRHAGVVFHLPLQLGLPGLKLLDTLHRAADLPAVIFLHFQVFRPGQNPFDKTLLEASNGRCVLVDQQTVAVVRVLPVAVGGPRPYKFSIPHGLILLCPNLLADVGGVCLIYHVFQRHNQMIAAVFRILAVKLVVDGDKAHSMEREILLNVVAGVNGVPPQPGKVLHHDTVNFAILSIRQHPLKGFLFKGPPRSTVVGVNLRDLNIRA